ncbi:MAG: glycosyltransferase [Planctomycetaceae bacterium]
MSETVFWVSLLGLLYIYVGYPLLVMSLAKIVPMRRSLSSPVEMAPDQSECQVSIVIASSNDGGVLHAKLIHLLESPQARFIREILVGSDGSTDDTGRLIREMNDDRILLFEFSKRRGKPAVLNELIPQCRSEILVLCDARQRLSAEAIPSLLSSFSDSKVGVVSGELVFEADTSGDSTAARGIGAYWHYEKSIRRSEARFRGVPGATGALYAIRKELFQPIPDSTLLDDVVIPMNAVVKGYRCVLEPRAIVWDTASDSLSRESMRKRRTIAGAAQLAINHSAWLLPWKNPIWMEFISHKLLRLVSPFLLLIVLVMNYQLVQVNMIYAGLLCLQAAFYCCAVAGWMCQRMGHPSALFSVQLAFTVLNLTTLAALWDAVRGRFRVTWQRS